MISVDFGAPDSGRFISAPPSPLNCDGRGRVWSMLFLLDVLPLLGGGGGGGGAPERPNDDLLAEEGVLDGPLKTLLSAGRGIDS